MVKINYKEVCVVTCCPFCGRANEIEVNENDYFDWDDGELAQVAFPYLTAEEREALISGTCPTCWGKMYGNAEEEENEEEWEDWNFNEDMGYDPYLGLYTDDC